MMPKSSNGRCPLCSNDDVSIERMIGNSPIFCCSKCSMRFAPPTSENIYKDEYFANSNLDKGYENYQNEFPAHYYSFQDRLRKTAKFLPQKGRHLDIGCALGHCGKASKDLGWDTYVTDISSFAVTHAAKTFELKAFVSLEHKLPLQNEVFDCITLFDVLEHMEQPLPFLIELRRTLSSNGILQITTPDIHSLTAKIMGSSWYHFKPGEHLLYFSKDTLKKILEKSGYEVLHIEPLPISMRFTDVLKRLRKYWRRGFNLAIKLAQKIKIDNYIITIYAGEMQAWARPKQNFGRALQLLKEDSENIYQCPKCEGQIQLSNHFAKCGNCSAVYGISNNVIQFSTDDNIEISKFIS